MFWLKYVHSLIKALNENESPTQLAAGFALGAIVGLCPKVSLLGLLLWGIIFFFQVNIGMAGAAAIIFSIIGAIFDPLTEKWGYFLLTGIPALEPLWTKLYNTPIIPFTNFNHSLVLGNLTVGILLWLPVFLFFRKGVFVYRERYRDQIKQSKLMKAMGFLNYSEWVERWIKK